MEEVRVRCCVVGGGPAGMMLGFLLARAGVNVLVLEKHADFLRDFRGDTVHPSTLQLFHELGLLEDFLRLPHQELTRIAAQIGDEKVWAADFTHLPTYKKCIVLMPQWDLLNFLAECGQRYPKFQLRMETEATDVVVEHGRVTGVRAKGPNGELVVRADLVVGTDGRHSIIREKAGLIVQDKGAPMDVFWMRLSRLPGDPEQSLGRFHSGQILVMINRGDYWQCAYVIPKGTARAFQVRGIESFRKEIARIAPSLADRVNELKDWDDVKLLTVKVDRLKRWYKPGVLCIGDAAHAMSPIGGVGINLAVQDAVAAANILAAPLAAGVPTDGLLQNVQHRREWPTRVTQRIQILAQDRIISKVLSGNQSIAVPDALKLMQKWPILQRIPARLIGIGVRPEHIRTKDVGVNG